MSAKTFQVRSIQVEMWETSFRVEGMSQVVHIGQHCTKEHVTSLVAVVKGWRTE